MHVAWSWPISSTTTDSQTSCRAWACKRTTPSWTARSCYNAVHTGYCSPGAGQENFNLYINGCDTDGRSFGDVPLDNLSRNTFNIALLYDRGPVSARIAYNWRGKYLYGVALNSDNTGPNQTNALDTNPGSATFGQHNLPVGLPPWADGYGQLDAGIHLKVGSDLSIGLEASNLLNKNYKQIMQQHIGIDRPQLLDVGSRASRSTRNTTSEFHMARPVPALLDS